MPKFWHIAKLIHLINQAKNWFDPSGQSPNPKSITSNELKQLKEFQLSMKTQVLSTKCQHPELMIMYKINISPFEDAVSPLSLEMLLDSDNLDSTYKHEVDVNVFKDILNPCS